MFFRHLVEPIKYKAALAFTQLLDANDALTLVLFIAFVAVDIVELTSNSLTTKMRNNAVWVAIGTYLIGGTTVYTYYLASFTYYILEADPSWIMVQHLTCRSFPATIMSYSVLGCLLLCGVAVVQGVALVLSCRSSGSSVDQVLNTFLGLVFIVRSICLVVPSGGLATGLSDGERYVNPACTILALGVSFFQAIFNHDICGRLEEEESTVAPGLFASSCTSFSDCQNDTIEDRSTSHAVPAERGESQGHALRSHSGEQQLQPRRSLVYLVLHDATALRVNGEESGEINGQNVHQQSKYLPGQVDEDDIK